MSNPTWFSHDVEAKHDPKITMLLMESGWAGYGLFWAILEDLSKEPDYEMHISKLKVLAYDYKLDITYLENIYMLLIEYNLLIENDEYFYSNSLKTRYIKLEEKRQKQSEGGKKGMANRHKKQTDTINDNKDNLVITNLQVTCNSIEENSIVEKRREKHNKKESIELREQNFKNEVFSFTQYENSMLNNFFNYWSEKNKNGKMLFETKLTWELSKRLSTWNNLNYGNKSNGTSKHEPETPKLRYI